LNTFFRRLIHVDRDRLAQWRRRLWLIPAATPPQRRALAAGSEKQQELDERLARVVSDTLQLGVELKGQLEELEERQQGLLQAFDGQLQEMQAFIVKAAEDAAKQRALLSAAAPAAVRQQPAVDDVELQQLLSRQQALQQQFAQRRRTEGEAAFRTPNGAGL